MLCRKCLDTGQYLGSGMMIVDCDLCDEDVPAKKLKPSLDRKSSSYRKAVKDIMKLDSSMSRDDAVRIFESEYCKD